MQKHGGKPKYEVLALDRATNTRGMPPIVMTLPSILLFLACYIFPIGYMIYLSLHEWDFISPVKEFVGLKNFKSLFQKAEFHQVLSNTFIFTVASVVITLCLAMLFAVWLNRTAKGYAFVQAAIFSPHIVALVSVAFVWMWLMDPNYGLLNYLLQLFGLPASTWLQHPKTAMPSLILVSVWKLVGYDTLILIAALQSIPKSIYEAADLDSAPKAATFFRIILPMVSPSLFFLLVMNTLSLTQNFDTVAVMTQGGPINATNTIVYYIYTNAFRFYKIGYASAAGVVLLGIVGVLTIVYFNILGKKVYYR